MKTRKQGTFYTESKPYETFTYQHKEDYNWWLSQDIQREIKLRTGHYISLSKIGRIAKQLNLVRDTGLGFKLYHKNVIDHIIENIPCRPIDTQGFADTKNAF